MQRPQSGAAGTHSLQAEEMWGGTVYLQSMIMVRVSLSLASWKGGWPHTSMKRMTPRLQISAHRRAERWMRDAHEEGEKKKNKGKSLAGFK